MKHTDIVARLEVLANLAKQNVIATNSLSERQVAAIQSEAFVLNALSVALMNEEIKAFTDVN